MDLKCVTPILGGRGQWLQGEWMECYVGTGPAEMEPGFLLLDYKFYFLKTHTFRERDEFCNG